MISRQAVIWLWLAIMALAVRRIQHKEQFKSLKFDSQRSFTNHNKRALSYKLQGLTYAKLVGFRTLAIRITNTKSHKFNARDKDCRRIIRFYMEYIKSRHMLWQAVN